MSVVVIGDIEKVGKIARSLGRSQELSTDVGQTAAALFQRHFLGLAATNRNPYGVRGGFWNRMIAGTLALATDSAAIVRMPAEVRLRHKGGTVKPKTKKYLAIPARGEAYGKSPRQFDNLAFVITDHGPALVQRNQTGVRVKKNRKTGALSIERGEETGGGVYYWLRRSATIAANPRILPSDQEVSQAALDGAAVFTRKVLEEA